MAVAGFWQLGNRSGMGRPNLDAFLSYGFRPFFLGAALYAVVLMAVWLVFIAATTLGRPTDWLPVSGSQFAWHAHELVYGFAGAAIAGFLLTAVPNWTGALPISGRPLGALFLIWLAGRLTMMASAALPAWLPAACDLVFLPALGGVAARQLLVKPSARNAVFLALLALMFAGNVSYHASVSNIVAVDPLSGPHLALWTIVVMMTIIGGRIIPSFTHNWININAPGEALPRRFAKLDVLSILAAAGTGAAVLAGAPKPWVVAVAAIAAVANGLRLAFWRGIITRREPIVWILHVGYAWIVCGLALTAAAHVAGSIAQTLAYHAFGTGAASTMILAIMTRASLGHTGRPIKAARPIIWAYVCVTLAASARVFIPLVAPQATPLALAIAAVAWIAAFAAFLVVYLPILTTPRVHTKLRPAN